MKTIILKSTLPVFIGIFNVLFLLVLVHIVVYKNFSFIADAYMLRYFVPVSATIAVIIQHFIVIPIWEKFNKTNTVWGLTIIHFTLIVCLLGGTLFSVAFWERDLGYGELLAVFLTGLIAFVIYWSSNLILLKYIDSRITH